MTCEMYPKIKDEIIELCQKMLEEIQELYKSDPKLAEFKRRRID